MKKIFIIIVIVFIICWLALEIYCRLPDNFDVRKIEIPRNTQTLVLLFHGSNDHQNPELKAIEENFKNYLNFTETTQIINYDWSYTSSYLKASANTIKIGNAIGIEISNLKNAKNIHLISHSAGAFIAESFCKSYRANGGSAHIETTFLDPFNLRGFSDFNYGVRNFGNCADFALSIINTDDSVPTTNTMLKNSWNIDITNINKPANFIGKGHYFPPFYYLLLMKEDIIKINDKNHNKYPRGEIMILND